MPLTPAQLETIRDECCADDVDIPDEAVAWIEPEARDFFMSGGVELPRKLGLEGAEVLAYYETRKQTVHNSSPEFLMGALQATLFGQGSQDAESGTPEPGSLAELQTRGVDLTELRALAEADRAALSERLRALGYSKLGHRLQLEKALLHKSEAEDGQELLRTLGLSAKWPVFKTDGLTSVARMLHALGDDREGFDKQMALMGIKRTQRKLLVAALRQTAGGDASRDGGAVGDGYLTEDDLDFDVDGYAAGGELR